MTEQNLKIYVCKRYEKVTDSYFSESWKGALVIAAESEKEAIDIYRGIEEDEPKQIVNIEFTKGVIYNDEDR